MLPGLAGQLASLAGHGHANMAITLCKTVNQTVHRVQVRTAPSMRFAYVEPRLMRAYLRFKTPQQAPSMLAPMTLKEFAMRAQQDSPDSPLFYPHGEFYYMQSPVTQDMRRSGDLDFEQSPFSAVLAPGMKLQQRVAMPCACWADSFYFVSLYKVTLLDHHIMFAS